MNDFQIEVDNKTIIRTWKPDDAEKLFRLTDNNRKYLEPWLDWIHKVKEEDDSKRFIEDSIQKYQDKVSMEMGIWENDVLIGCIGLHGLSERARRANVGYWLGNEYSGQGIMTKSVKSLIDYSFNKLNLNRIGVEIATENKKSLAVAERLGFVKEGVIRQYEFINNRFLDYVVLSKLKSEWN
jgi:ribosomal-protein-serine acetyltransferase